MNINYTRWTVQANVGSFVKSCLLETFHRPIWDYVFTSIIEEIDVVIARGHVIRCVRETLQRDS